MQTVNRMIESLLRHTVLLCVIAVSAVSCSERQDPPPAYKGYIADMRDVIFLPTDGGVVDINLYSPEGEWVIPIDLLAVSPAFAQQPMENLMQYVESGLVCLPEQVYREAGFSSYPNDIGFGYTFKWATVSTYMIPGKKDGTMRIVFDENPTTADRKIYVHFNGFYKETVEICQDGRDEI